LTEEYIRQRAYQRFEQRGWQHGHDLEDWIQAEAEIMGKTRASASGDGRVPRDLAQAA
jgi:hypothetical protein